MANNLVVQLLLKSGSFNNDLKHAGGQVNQFKQNCSTAGKALTQFGNAMGINIGSITKFTGVVGAAVFAGKELKAILDSTQTSSDNLQGAIAGCKGVLEQFNTSIASADFSAFKTGLWEVYEAAKAVQDALDQLGNTQIAYDFMTKENQTKFMKAYTIFKDKNSTEEMKEAAKKQMKEAVDAQYKYANNYSSSLYKTYVAQVVKKAGKANLEGFRVTAEQFRKAMKIDLGMEGNAEQQRESINSQYQDYLRKLKEYGKNNLTAQENLKKQYADVIAIHAMLELMKDDELKGIATVLGQMEEAKQVAEQMNMRMVRALNPEVATKTTKEVNKNLKEEEVLLEGTRAYWEDIAKKSRETLYHSKEFTDEWKQANDQLTEALDKIAEIDLHIKAYNSRKNFVPLERLPEIKGGFQLGTQTPEVPEVPVQDSFTQAMANTSTIVSALTNTFKENTEVTAASILQMVATSLPAIGQLIGSIEALTAVEAVEAGVAATGKAVSSSKHWIEAIAAVAALGAVVASAISNSKTQAQKFATGGIVGGNSFTGDRVSAQVNSGEMILTKAQQARLVY